MKKQVLIFVSIFTALAGLQAQELIRSVQNLDASQITTAVINSECTAIVSGGTNKHLYTWNAKTGDHIQGYTMPDAIGAVAYSTTNKYFAGGAINGSVFIYDAVAQKQKPSLTLEHTATVTSLAFNPVNDFLISGSKDNTAKVWDGVSKGSTFTLRGHTKAVNAVVYSPDGKIIATGSSDNTIKIWDAISGELAKTIDAASKEVTALAWSSDGKYLVSGGSGGMVIVWDAITGARLWDANFKSEVNSISISPDVQYFAVGGANEKVVIWNIETKEKAKEFEAHDKDVTSLAFADNGKLLITTSKDGNLKFWDINNLKIGKKKFAKDANEPKLTVVQPTLKDNNHNDLLEKNEKATINFTIKNEGKGQVYNAIARVTISNVVVGLHYEKEVVVGNIESDKFISVSIPISADSTLETTKGTFNIEIKDANGYAAAPLSIPFETGSGYSFITLVSHSYTSATGKAEVGAPITLKLKFKNTSSGDAKNIKIHYEFPEGVFAVNKKSEIISSLNSGEDKELSVEFYASKDFKKANLFPGVFLDGAFSNIDQIKFEIKMNQPLPTTEIASAIVNPTTEAPEAPTFRGSGDPLKGLNVTKSKDMVIGNYYALIIGIDNYKGTWPTLKNAVNDAKAIETMLKGQYKFDHFKTLYNEQATRSSIIAEFETLIATAKEQDNVFIYYSGHGEFKKELNKGFWVPIDASSNSTSNYISNSDIQNFLGGIKSKHTLLVADACFSGDIFRGNTISVPFEESEKYYKEVHGLPSRQAMTSGGLEPVMDGGKDGHSVFAYYFLKTLKDNGGKYLDASQIYNKIKIPVINNSEQSPKLAPVKNTGDEGGQFLFIKK